MPTESRTPSAAAAQDTPNTSGAVSLADVARLAGVSTGTVSRTLSKPEMISEATRLRVTEAVERLGYVANGAARALALRRTMTVGAIVPRFGSSSFAALIHGLETSLSEAGYTLLLSTPDAQGKDQDGGVLRGLRALLERGVDAVALLGGDQPASVLSLLAQHRTRYVTMWSMPDAGGQCIGFDEQAAARLIVQHLLSLGHRSVGFIGGRTTNSERLRRRLQEFALASAAGGLALHPQAMIDTAHGFAEGFAAMQEIARREPPISAVVCASDYLAAGALAALDQAGIAVPQRLSVASYNDNDFAPYLHPPLTTVRLPIRQIGQQAAQHLLAQLRGETPPQPLPLPVQLMQRGSTGPVAH